MQITREEKDRMFAVTYSAWSDSRTDPLDTRLIGYFTTRDEATQEASRGGFDPRREPRVEAHFGAAPLSLEEASQIEREMARDAEEMAR